MSNFEFIKYEPTPGEKHIGIATVKAFGKIVLRYKIVPNKDGTGFFPASASYKMPNLGDERIYISAFLLDSRTDEEEVNSLIRTNVKNNLNKPNLHTSVFGSDNVPF